MERQIRQNLKFKQPSQSEFGLGTSLVKSRLWFPFLILVTVVSVDHYRKNSSLSPQKLPYAFAWHPGIIFFPQSPSHCLLLANFQTNHLKLSKHRLQSPLSD